MLRLKTWRLGRPCHMPLCAGSWREKGFMERASTKMVDFQDVMSCVENLYVWQYVLDDEGGLALEATNCPEEAFWKRVFLSFFSERVLEAMKNSDTSVFISDDIGIFWIATPEREGGRLQKTWLLGPVFTSDTMAPGVSESLNQKGISIAYKRELVRQLKRLPSISIQFFLILGTMFHFCVTNTHIHVKDIKLLVSEETTQRFDYEGGEEIAREKGRKLGSGAKYEIAMLKAVREGNIQYESQVNEDFYETVGTLAVGNALRQKKDEIIVSITLCSRAAIEGGLSRDTSLAISDFYIQELEKAGTISEVAAVQSKMRGEYIRRVHDLKQNAGLSPIVVTCMDYIDGNLASHLTVADVAANTGYAGYYISTLFREETGQSISDYIRKKKIGYAKLLLQKSDQSVKEIAEELGYATSSHFCALFRKETGMSPAQYREESKYKEMWND